MNQYTIMAQTFEKEKNQQASLITFGVAVAMILAHAGSRSVAVPSGIDSGVTLQNSSKAMLTRRSRPTSSTGSSIGRKPAADVPAQMERPPFRAAFLRKPAALAAAPAPQIRRGSPRMQGSWSRQRWTAVDG